MENNKEMTIYLYQNIKMGVTSLKTLKQNLTNKDNKIKGIIDQELKDYSKFLKNINDIAKKKKINLEEKVMAEMMANMGMKLDLIKDNSDAKIADMLTKGTTMGIVDVRKRIDNYDDKMDKDILSLAKNYLKFLEKNIEELKIYL